MSSINKIRKDGVDYDIAGNEIYSTEEQIVGTWLDGKPIYRKVVELGNLPNATTKDITLNIQNVNEIVSINAICSNESEVWVIPNAYSTQYINGIVVRFANNIIENISIYASFDASGFTGRAVLEYTKTTD